MKVAVIGAGALGSLFGGLLAEAGNEVWLLHHRQAAARAIAEDGVVIQTRDGTTRRVDVHATVDASEAGPVELALVLVKAHQTIPAIEQHQGCLGPETRVLSLQNGVTNHHRLRNHVGGARSLHGVTYQGVTAEGNGRVRRTDPGRTVLGGEDHSFAERTAKMFEEAGIETAVVADPFEPIWEKQLWGAAIKPLAALTRLPNRELVSDEGLVDVMNRVMVEAAAVAETEGIELDADATFATLRSSLAESEHTSSMLQDIEADRRTEIEDVNGAVVALGREADVDVPVNETLTKLVKGLERGHFDED